DITDGLSGASDANSIGGSNAGEGNVIAFNNAAGVAIHSFSGFNNTGNRILGNSIFSNGALGIDLGNDGVTPNDTGDPDTGANTLQNYPVLTSATVGAGLVTVGGTLNSVASNQFRLEFFASPACDPSGNGEGALYLGSLLVLTDGSGNVSFQTTLPSSVAPGARVTATATRTSTNDTSEFSACVTATGANFYTVT